MVESVERVRPQAALAGILKYWAPPIVWMAAIFYFSTDTFSGDNTGSLLEKIFSFIYPGIMQELLDSIHFYIRKAGHFTGYAILALLLFRACRSGARARWRWKWAIGSLLVVVFYALLDEYHQTFTRHRVGSIYDSLIDTSGAVAALVSLWLFRRKSG
ncbi:MAG: VanZ family protein [Acidobacteria bacterium]|nr:VanZ family protein [Acidobacteriota bacterium]